jgi:hypothetical protein
LLGGWSAREHSRLTRHLAERAQRATVTWPTVSTQQPTNRKVLSQHIVATPRTGQARKCRWQGIRAGWRCGGGSHRCAAAVSGGSDGRGSRPRLGKLLRGGWVIWDLPRRKGGGWLGLATVSRSWKKGQKWQHPYRRTAKLVARTTCKEGGVHFYPRDQRMDGTSWIAARARGEMGPLGAAQRRSTHAR